MFFDGATLLFFTVVQQYIRSFIHHVAADGMARMFSAMSVMAMTLLTLWIMIQGYRIMTGQSREPLIGFIINASKTMFIISVATGAAVYGDKITDVLDTFQHWATYIVTGKDGNVYDMIDASLAQMQVLFSAIGSLAQWVDAGNKTGDFTRIMWASGIGTAGPAMVGGMMTLLYEIGLSLAQMFAPFFIMALLFEQTKQMFWNWVKFSIGMFFMLGVTALMVNLALNLTIGYAGAVLLSGAIDGQINGSGNTHIASIADSAMTLGGLGIVFSTLIITVPPMVMQFFQASVGTGFSYYSAFGKNASKEAPGEKDKKGQDNKNTSVSDNDGTAADPTSKTTSTVSATTQLTNRTLSGSTPERNSALSNSNLPSGARSITNEEFKTHQASQSRRAYGISPPPPPSPPLRNNSD